MSVRAKLIKFNQNLTQLKKLLS